jgi:hypothetical protein
VGFARNPRLQVIAGVIFPRYARARIDENGMVIASASESSLDERIVRNRVVGGGGDSQATHIRRVVRVAAIKLFPYSLDPFPDDASGLFGVFTP